MTNISYLPNGFQITAYLSPGRITLLVTHGADHPPLVTFDFDHYRPVVTFTHANADGGQGYYKVQLKNMDATSLQADPWLTVEFDNRKAAIDAASKIQDAIWNPFTLPANALGSRLITTDRPAPPKTRLNRLSSSIISGLVGIAIGYGANMAWHSSGSSYGLATREKAMANRPVESFAKAFIAPSQTNETLSAPASRTNGKPNELKLTLKALENLKVAARISGLTVPGDSPSKGSKQFWMFVNPSAQEGQTLLQRTVELSQTLSELNLSALVMPVSESDGTSDLKMMSTLCQDGKSDSIRQIPAAWLTGLGSVSATEPVCEGAAVRVKLSTSLFDYFGFLRAPVIVSSSGAVTAFANATAAELLDWLKEHK